MKIELCGKMEIWSQEYDSPAICIGKEDLTSYINDYLIKALGHEVCDKENIDGTYRFTLERIDGL